MKRPVGVPHAWTWDAAHRAARRWAERDGVRYRVSATPSGLSPTGWCWYWGPLPAPPRPCPRCGSATEAEFDCPTYRSSRGGWMRCTPPCGDAEVYDCTRKGCGWYYAAGYAWENPNHASLLAGRGVVPEWWGERQ